MEAINQLMTTQPAFQAGPPTNTAQQQVGYLSYQHAQQQQQAQFQQQQAQINNPPIPPQNGLNIQSTQNSAGHVPNSGNDNLVAQIDQLLQTRMTPIRQAIDANIRQGKANQETLVGHKQILDNLITSSETNEREISCAGDEIEDLQSKVDGLTNLTMVMQKNIEEMDASNKITLQGIPFLTTMNWQDLKFPQQRIALAQKAINEILDPKDPYKQMLVPVHAYFVRNKILQPLVIEFATPRIWDRISDKESGIFENLKAYGIKIRKQVEEGAISKPKTNFQMRQYTSSPLMRTRNILERLVFIMKLDKTRPPTTKISVNLREMGISVGGKLINWERLETEHETAESVQKLLHDMKINVLPPKIEVNAIYGSMGPVSNFPIGARYLRGFGPKQMATGGNNQQMGSAADIEMASSSHSQSHPQNRSDRGGPRSRKRAKHQ